MKQCQTFDYIGVGAIDGCCNGKPDNLKYLLIHFDGFKGFLQLNSMADVAPCGSGDGGVGISACPQTNLCSYCQNAASYLRGAGFSDVAAQVGACISGCESCYGSRQLDTYGGGCLHAYGLMQVTNTYWCQDNIHGACSPGSNGCQVSCSDMRDNKLANAICAKIIYDDSHGWGPWDCRSPDAAGYPSCLKAAATPPCASSGCPEDCKLPCTC